MRASQINGCAYCLDMHSKDARAAGETEQRLYLLDAWRETPLYSERERAALEWTEAVTLVADGHVPDDVYAEVSKHFSEEELVSLSLGRSRDQRMESAQCRVPHRGGKLSGAGAPCSEEWNMSKIDSRYRTKLTIVPRVGSSPLRRSATPLTTASYSSSR